MNGFKTKRSLEKFRDSLRNSFGNFVSRSKEIKCKIQNHIIVCHVVKAKNELSHNIKENNQNWRDRIILGEGFEIQKEDI